MSLTATRRRKGKKFTVREEDRTRSKRVVGITESALTGRDSLRKRRVSRYGTNGPSTDQIMDALCNLLGYVTLDGDGGILNIHSDDIDKKTGQRSKLFCLHKSKTQIMLACFKLLSIVLNSFGIVFLTIRVVHRYLNQLEGPEAELAINCRVPLAEMIIGVKVIETTFVLRVILQVMWHLLVNLFPSALEKKLETKLDSIGEVTRNESVPEEGVFRSSITSFNSIISDVPQGKIYAVPKYMRISAILWNLLPRLCGFSALQIVQFSHPSLATKTLDLFTWKELAARHLAERFLKRREDTVTQEEIRDGLIRTILMLQHGADCLQHEESRESCYGYLDNTLFELVWILFDVQRDREVFHSSEVDWTALNRIGRLRIVWWAEDACKFGLLLFSFAAGCITLFTKLCIFCSLIVMEAADPRFICAYGLLFLNQMVNILDVERWMVWRTTVFLFGGADSKLSTEEDYIMQVYMGILCEKILESNLSFTQKFAIMMTLDDDDLQRLIVEEHPGRKGGIILGIRHLVSKSWNTESIEDALLVCLLGASREEELSEEMMEVEGVDGYDPMLPLLPPGKIWL